MNLKDPRLVLVSIVALFAVPLLLAVLMRSDWWDFRPASVSNRGVLVQPPVALAPETLDLPIGAGLAQARARPQWTVLYPLPARCLEACRKDAFALRQLHIATGRDRDRVTVLLLAGREPSPQTRQELLGIYPEFAVAVDSSGSVARSLPPLDDDGAAPAVFGDGRAFLLDPPGNIILGYPPGFDPNDIKKDLKRLLTWSVQDS